MTVDPRYHTTRIRGMLDDLIQHARQDIKELDDSPRAQALLETTAEVLQGLQTAYRHYDEKSEAAWQDGG